jgi:hypothetical protein
VPLRSGAIIGRGTFAGTLRIDFAGTLGFTLIAGVMIVAEVGLAGAWPRAAAGITAKAIRAVRLRKVVTGDFLFSVKKSRLASAVLVQKTLCAESDQEPLPSGRLPTLAPRASSFFFIFFGLLLFFCPRHFEQTFLQFWHFFGSGSACTSDKSMRARRTTASRFFW